MEIQKEISTLALDWTEEQYRNSEELHYSQIAKFEKVGFAGLDHLFDKEESPALTLGNLVDVLLTGDSFAFEHQFYVADFPSMGDKELQIANRLYEICGSTCPTFIDVPDSAILAAADEFDYQKRFKPETKIEKLTEACSAYYNLRVQAGDKAVISQKTCDEAVNMVRAIRESPSTSGYFAENDPFSPVQRYYQLKFRAVLDGIGYVVMNDLIIVNYEKKRIYQVDLKTSGKPEYLFEDSFAYWQYVVQSRLYYQVLNAVLSKDDYFKDFEIMNFHFVVVNKESLTPLVWEFPYTKSLESLYDERGNEYRSPLEIGKELQSYLNMRPQVPNGITMDGINIINCLKPKENV